jgi:hypothetical protein
MALAPTDVLTQQRETPADFLVSGDQDVDPVLERWKAELQRGIKHYEKYHKRVDSIITRYRAENAVAKDQSDTERRYNILWSMVSTIQPNLYVGMPRPYVSRRYKDKDPVARYASQILERALIFMNDSDDVDDAMGSCVDDYILGARGVLWTRYKPVFDLRHSETKTYYKDETKVPDEAEKGEDEEGTYYRESVPKLREEVCETDHIQMHSFLTAPASTFKQLPWIAKRVFMNRQELTKRFKDKGKDIALQFKSDGTKLNSKKNAPGETDGLFLCAEVWEIWCQLDRKVRWLALDHDEMLDEQDDPLQLKNFFPIPKPLFGTMTANSIIPVPDFKYYEDIANELDELTFRISLLTQALRVVGAYDASLGDEFKQILTNTRENAVLPIQNWNQITEGGGFKKAVDFLPIEQIIIVLEKLYESRKALVAELYEITGMSDIVRGNTDPRETAKAQQIKGTYASQRLKRQQRKVAKFHRSHMEIQAEILCKHYDDDTIRLISDAEQFILGPDGKFDAQAFKAAVELLRNDPLRAFRIKIDNRTLADDDLAADREDGMMFIQNVTQLLAQGLPVAQEVPKLGPVIKEIILFGTRMFPIARSIETTLEQALDELSKDIPPKKDEGKAAAGKSPEEMAVLLKELDIKVQSLGVERQRLLLEEKVGKWNHDVQMATLAQNKELSIISEKRQLATKEADLASRDRAAGHKVMTDHAKLEQDDKHKTEDRAAKTEQAQLQMQHQTSEAAAGREHETIHKIGEMAHSSHEAGQERQQADKHENQSHDLAEHQHAHQVSSSNLDREQAARTQSESMGAKADSDRLKAETTEKAAKAKAQKPTPSKK